MRTSLSLKMLLRSPLRAAITFLLLAAVSFGLMLRVCEYAMTSQEMRRAMSLYVGVGALDNGVPGTDGQTSLGAVREPPDIVPLADVQIGALSALPQVSLADTRYMTGGISADFPRLDMPPGFESFTQRFVMEVTLEDIYEAPGRYRLTFGDCELLTSDQSALGPRGTIEVFAAADSAGNPFGQSFVNSLEPGGRYVLAGTWSVDYTPDNPKGVWSYKLGLREGWDYFEPYWDITGAPENYLETDEFSQLRELIEITESDRFTYDMVYTSDMRSIPRFAEKKMMIFEGRGLTEADLGSNVCVVSRGFLSYNRLEMGDKITVSLCGKLLNQHGGLGAVACVPERYSKPVTTVELEIVGTFSNTDLERVRMNQMYWSYSPNTIFVPSSLLPVIPPEDHDVMPGEFSVLIEDTGEIEAFPEAAGPLAEELGVRLFFDDGGWTHVSENYTFSMWMSLITIALFILAVVIALWLAVYLYIGRSRREYAIMRALGATRRRSGLALLLPLGVMSAAAIAIGGALGCLPVSLSADSLLTGIVEKTSAYVPSGSLPVAAIACCALGELGMLFLLAVISLRKLGNMQSIILLQGGATRRRPAGYMAPARGPGDTPPPSVGTGPIRPVMPVSSGGRYGAARHVPRYVARHIRRTGWKAVLSVLLAAMLSGAMGLFALTRFSYADLFDRFEIKCYVSGISSNAVRMVNASPLAGDMYYHGEMDAVLAGLECRAVITNSLSRYAQAEVTVDYAEGYNDKVLSKPDAVCLLGSGLAGALGFEVNPGDDVSLMSVDSYRGRINGLKAADPPLDEEEIMALLFRYGVGYKVAGIITSGPDELDMAFVTMASSALDSVTGTGIALDMCEITLSDNSKTYEMRAYAKTLVDRSRGVSPDAALVMDSANADNVRRILTLLEMLYPIVLAAAVLIGAAAPGLIIIQSAKEAAMLRVLGTTKKRTRCILALEQLLLCIIGLALAAGGLAAYNAGMFAKAGGTLAFCGGLYLLGCLLAVISASVGVTRRGALELLQTKE